MTRSSRAITALWLLTIAFCISLSLDLIPLLRGAIPGFTTKDAWIWNYSPPRWAWVVPCVLGVAAYVLAMLYILERERDSRYPVRLIALSFVGSALIPLLLMTLEGAPLFLLFTRSASYLTGGYQEAITLFPDLTLVLRTWPQFMTTYRTTIHPVGGLPLSPPGWVAAYYAAAQVFGSVPALAHTFGALVRPLECQNDVMMGWTDAQMASAWLQMAMPLWAALAIAPLYRLGVMIFDRRTARWAVALWPLLPTIAMFTPRFNSFYPVITLIMLAILWRGLDRGNLGLVALAGFIVSVAIFLNLTLVPLGLLAGLTILGHAIYSKDKRKSNWPRVAVNLGVFGLGSISVWVTYSALSGVSPLQIVQLGMAFNAQIERPYLPWLAMHPYDMFLFVGLPIAALSIWRILQVRNLANRADVFAAVSGLTLLILVLSGTARGETGRVWSFFAPLWILLAANIWQRLGKSDQIKLYAVQAVYLLCIAAVLRVNVTDLTVPTSVASAARGPGFAANAQFVSGSDAITFVGFDFDQTPTTLNLHLHWRADSLISRPYYLSLVTVPPDGSGRPGITWTPVDHTYPPSCWRPGQEFVDDRSIDLGKNPTGGWLFSLAITDLDTRQPMAVVGDSTAQVGIGPIQVKAN